MVTTILLLLYLALNHTQLLSLLLFFTTVIIITSYHAMLPYYVPRALDIPNSHNNPHPPFSSYNSLLCKSSPAFSPQLQVCTSKCLLVSSLKGLTDRSFCPGLIPIDHHLCCKDGALHFSLTFRQTQTVVLNFEACALEIGSLLSVRTTRCSHILPPLL